MLVVNESSVSILFGATQDKILIDHELTPCPPLYMVSPAIASFLGKNNLVMEMWSLLLIAHHFMEFFIVDHRSVYYGVIK